LSPRESLLTGERPIGQFDDGREQSREGWIARGIEKQTARLPSDAFLWAALGAIAVSAPLQFMGNREVGNFVGQWAPTFLMLGLYNKMVKQLGSDRTENAIYQSFCAPARGPRGRKFGPADARIKSGHAGRLPFRDIRQGRFARRPRAHTTRERRPRRHPRENVAFRRPAA
jgi:hypothetical protein